MISCQYATLNSLSISISMKHGRCSTVRYSVRVSQSAAGQQGNSESRTQCPQCYHRHDDGPVLVQLLASAVAFRIVVVRLRWSRPIYIHDDRHNYSSLPLLLLLLLCDLRDRLRRRRRLDTDLLCAFRRLLVNIPPSALYSLSRCNTRERKQSYDIARMSRTSRLSTHQLRSILFQRSFCY